MKFDCSWDVFWRYTDDLHSLIKFGYTLWYQLFVHQLISFTPFSCFPCHVLQLFAMHFVEWERPAKQEHWIFWERVRYFSNFVECNWSAIFALIYNSFSIYVPKGYMFWSVVSTCLLTIMGCRTETHGSLVSNAEFPLA